ncbi:uncharacterized protein YgbK (DUF1537 family) [Arcicella aurantiaca]|uniref:Uncharacterized protein YgbK (DUF1537 family) n=1 Tax=Arcicella aurantiaca TaxID=591202 RepID=A0A316EAS9_9BACT|nr:four-carbon acid sugar kinase family protein [Arcicella aurantiaca]PWK27555.1 uncharacterized protein YgbK (DUF1537 family) [Arcicella aurantiaca]
MKSPIIVIADDLTGAAEIAGIGLRYGLNVEILTTLNLDFQADLVVISANTRSLSALEAQEKTRILAEQIAKTKPQFIFKKIDSVLRGHILTEINEILTKNPFEKTLILPANPSLGRTIIEGKYFVNGISIEETSFANDPEFAIRDANVLSMIRAENNEVKFIKPAEKVSQNGIFICEASSKQDVDFWASVLTKDTLLVGAADFFDAILARSFKQQKLEIKELKPLSDKPKTLYISGTTYQKSVVAIKEKYLKNEAVSYLPIKLFIEKPTEFALEKWAKEILVLFETKPTIIIAIGDLADVKVLPQQLAKWMSLVVKTVSEKCQIDQFLIEGGATAAAILATLSYKSFIPTNEFSQGVICLKPQENQKISITIKPGSYEWPSKIWQF